MRDTVDLDVHAIAELQSKGVAATDDKPKYDYTAEESNEMTSKYGKRSTQ